MFPQGYGGDSPHGVPAGRCLKAEASRSLVMRKYYPADCDRYLAKALKAWKFLQESNNYVQYFHYGATFGDWDERLLGGGRTVCTATGAPTNTTSIFWTKSFDPSRKLWNWKPLVECVGYAVDTYVFMTDRPRDPEMLKRCQAALHDACKTLLADSAAYPYRPAPSPKRSSAAECTGWMFPGDFAGYNLLMGYAMEKRPLPTSTCALIG